MDNYVPVKEQLVIEELREIPDWNKLGAHLGVPDHTRREIELQFLQAHGVERCRNELISKWWKRTPNANWGDVIAALKKMEEYRLATRLEKKYRKTVTPQPAALTLGQPAEHCLDLTQLPSGGYSLSHGPIQLVVSADVPHNLLQLMRGYADMLHMIRRADLSSETLKDLKFYLVDMCDDDQSVLDCSTTDALVVQLKRYISMFNIEILTIIYDKFKSSAVEESIQKYKQQLNTFLSNTSIKQLKDAFQSQAPRPTTVESITMKLDESSAEATLAALKKLAYHLFGISSKTLILFEVQSGCIAITWLAPMAVVPILKRKAEQHSPTALSRLGVLEVVIGLKIISSEYQAQIDEARILAHKGSELVSELSEELEKEQHLPKYYQEELLRMQEQISKQLEVIQQQLSLEKEEKKELQESGIGKEERVLTRAADLASYRNLKAVKMMMRLIEKEKELKAKKEELGMMKNVGLGILHQMETQSQELREKEQLIKQLKIRNTALKQEIDQLNLVTMEETVLQKQVHELTECLLQEQEEYKKTQPELEATHQQLNEEKKGEPKELLQKQVHELTEHLPQEQEEYKKAQPELEATHQQLNEEKKEEPKEHLQKQVHELTECVPQEQEEHKKAQPELEATHQQLNEEKKEEPKKSFMGKKKPHGIHNPKTKAKLVKYLVNPKVDVNAENDAGETALHSYVHSDRPDKLELLVTLLSHCNCKVLQIDKPDRYGNSPLLIAVEINDLTTVKTLIAFGADINSQNPFGETPLDRVVKQLHFGNRDELHELLTRLHALPGSAILCPSPVEDPVNQSINSILNESYEIVEAQALGVYLEPKRLTAFVFKLEEMMKQQALEFSVNTNLSIPPGFQDHNLTFFDPMIARQNQLLRISEWKSTVEFNQGAGSRMLILDGGGIRGLIEIEILEKIEKITGRRIIELFDWVVGTSTGGIIALALVYLGMSLPELRQLYFRMRDEVLHGGLMSTAKKSEALEHLLRSNFLNINLRDKDFPRVMIGAVSTKQNPPRLHFFNNCFDDEFSRQPVWKVARYTTAGPGYFTECDCYMDGGVLANNPSLAAWTKIKEFYEANYQPAPKISMVVSLGTGIYPPEKMGSTDILGKGRLLDFRGTFKRVQRFFKMLATALSESESVVVSFRATCDAAGIKFFRFSPSLISIINQYEIDPLIVADMIIQAKEYLGIQSTQRELDEMVRLFRHIADISRGLHLEK